MASSFNLHCWNCENGLNPKKTKIADAATVFMLKSGDCCHLTCTDVNLPNVSYLREHPVAKSHNIKPFRFHCKVCKNQLGVVVWSAGGLKPSFHQNAVIFKNSVGKEIHPTQWKYGYAQRHNVIPNENIGTSSYRKAEEPQFYILDHKAWEFAKNGDLRVQTDSESHLEEDLEWKLSGQNPYYEASYKSDNSKPLPGTQQEKSQVDDETPKIFSRMSLGGNVGKPKRAAKPIPAKFANANIFSSLRETM